MSEHHPWTRRAFLQNGLTMVSTAATLPLFLQRSAFGINDPRDRRATAQQPGVPEDRILVVIQLGGGNDGLNTVIPFGDSHYYTNRPTLAVRQQDALVVDEGQGIGLHGNLAALKELYDEGVVAICQGVGYPNPNRSHFKSMDIWHTADVPNGQGTGWLGRYFDNTCAGSPQADRCIAIGREAPIATMGKTAKAISFESARLFRWAGEDLHDELGETYQKINRGGSPTGALKPDQTNTSFLMRTALDAQISSDKIRKAVARRAEVSYPGSALARQLKMIGAMIRSGLTTRVYYATMGGFDTHAGQQYRHANLLKQYAESIRAFYRDLKDQGNHQRVLILTFSEFGRRVKENASRGTDHGTAAPMFVIGDMVRPGVHGPHPSLSKLDKGDLIYHTDFRQIYAAALEHWMKADSEKILRGKFKPAPVLDTKNI